MIKWKGRLGEEGLWNSQGMWAGRKKDYTAGVLLERDWGIGYGGTER